MITKERGCFSSFRQTDKKDIHIQKYFRLSGGGDWRGITTLTYAIVFIVTFLYVCNTSSFDSQESRKKSSSTSGPTTKRGGGKALVLGPLMEELFLRFRKNFTASLTIWLYCTNYNKQKYYSTKFPLIHIWTCQNIFC